MLTYLIFLSSRYTIDKLDEDKSFEIDMYAEVCIDGYCEIVSILSRVLVPIPLCNTITLPGDGTLQGVLDQLIQDASDAGVNFILETFGIKVRSC